MIDQTEILITFLNSQSAITALVDDRISSQILPEDVAVLPAITVTEAGGESDKYTPIVRANFQIKAWAAGRIAAAGLYEKIHEALHVLQNETVGSDHVYAAWEEVLGQLLIDPDTGFFVKLGIFNLLIRNP